MDGVANLKADLPWAVGLVGVDGSIRLRLDLRGSKVLDGVDGGVDGGGRCAGFTCRIIPHAAVIRVFVQVLTCRVCL